MCGICGFYSKNLSTFNNIIEEMNSAIFHRGPDHSGYWVDKNTGIFFGHQRLSILDLTADGNQPMQSNSGRFILNYNGEIYNYLEIRKELNNKNINIKWRGKSDTETLLEAIDFWGVEITLQKIDGMFAFGIWDKKKRSLTLARDRIGEKPLYYGWQGEGHNKVFLFGSELKALKVHPSFETKINRDAISLQLRYNCIPAPHSIYKNIYKLLPGHYLKLNESDLKKSIIPISKTYWSLVEKAVDGNNNQIKKSDIDIQKDLEKYLRSSVKKQMIADVPLGAFLSGGIDSSTVVALMQLESNHPVKTFTIGFNENDYSEAKKAKKIAQHLSTDHTEFFVTPKLATEAISTIPFIYDEPFSDSSQVPTYIVSKLAKKHVKVALTGDGGDELFCGYNRYKMVNFFLNTIQPLPLSFRKILSYCIEFISPQTWTRISKFFLHPNKYLSFGDKIHKANSVLNSKSVYEYYHTLCSNWKNPTEVVKVSKEQIELYTGYKSKFEKLNNQEIMMIMDFITYLPNDILVKVDRASMATSLETRAPFLDHKLIEYVWKIPHHLKFRNNQGKWILKQILNQYVPKNLTEGPKMGFGLPIDSWLRGSLRDWAENLLNEKRLTQEGYFNPKLIREKWEEHLSGKKNWQHELWSILMFQAWIDANN